jgi:hypothetical protein
MPSGLRLKETSDTEGEHDSRVVHVLKGGGVWILCLLPEG